MEDEDFDTFMSGLDDDLEDDEDDEDGDLLGLTDAEIEEAGSLDGDSDSGLGNARYSGFGSSIDLDDLTDEQRELYEMGYESGFSANDDLDDDVF